MSRRVRDRRESVAQRETKGLNNLVRRTAFAVAEALEGRQLLAGATPVFWYKFDEGSGTSVTDIGENGANPKNNGTLVGDVIPQWVPGASGNPGDFALKITNAPNPANPGNPYYNHRVTGAVVNATTPGAGPFAEGLVQLQNNIDPNNPTAPTPDLSSWLNQTSSLAVWVKVAPGVVGSNNTWAAPSITGAEGRGLVNDIRWGYLDASGRIGVAAGDAPGVTSATPINDGAWHLVVMSRNEATDRITVWVDGALSGQGVRNTQGAAGPLGTRFNVIGAQTNTTNNGGFIEGYAVFNGELDDFRVFDHELTAAEVQALLPTATTAPNAPTNAQVALASGLARVTWTDNANNELSYLIERTTADPANPNQPNNSGWRQVGSAGAVSGTGLQGSFTDTSSAYSGTRFFYRVRAFNSFNGGSHSAYATTATPVAIPVAPANHRYQFNEGSGTTVADSGTPGGNAGTLSPTPPTFVPGPQSGNTALSFSGTDQYVQLANNMGPVVGTNNGSVAAWVKTTAINTGAIAGTHNTNTPIGLRWGLIDGQGRIGVGVGTSAIVTSNGPINDGQWHHVAMTRDVTSGEIKIYVDGELQTTGTAENGNKIAQFTRIGATTNVDENGAPANTFAYFTGDLDDVRFYNSVLSPTDVVGLALPAATTAPAAPTNFTATVNGGVVNLSWRDNADNEFNYAVLRGDSPDGPFTEIGKVPGVAGSGTTVNFADTTGGRVGQTAYYRVRAFNAFNGGTSATAANTPSATYTGHGQGVQGHFFNQSFWAGEPSVRVFAGRVDANWPANPDPSITSGRASTIYTGRIRTTDPGLYTFVSNSDDDGHLFVNGVLVSTDPGDHGERNATVLTPITLAGNTDYNFVFMQSNSGGGAAGAHMRWVTPAMSGAGQTTPVAIPHTNLTSQTTAPSTPTDFAADPTMTAHSIDFNFNTNNIGVVEYQLQRSGDGGQSWRTVSELLPVSSLMDGSGTVFPVAARIQDATAVPGETYQYRLIARNFDHTSAPMPAVTVTVPSDNPQSSGLQVRYYNGELLTDQDPRNFAVLPGGPTEVVLQPFGFIGFPATNFQALSPDETLYGSFPRVNNESFSTVWTGKIRTNAAGVYTFVTNSDDDAILFVNGVAVSQDLGAHGARDATTLVPLTLAANTDYNFVLLHNDRIGNSSIELKWIEPGQPAPSQVIPTGFPGTSGGLLMVMDAPYQQSVGPTGVITENTAGSAAGSLASATPAVPGVRLTWTDQSLSELWFEVQRATSAAGPFVDVGRAGFNTGEFTDTTAVPGNTYFYRVRGANFDGIGPWSGVVQATAVIPVTDTITGTAGDDTIVLRRSTDGQFIDWTMGTTSGRVAVNNANGLTINGGGGNDTITLDTANGSPLPNLLTLGGAFTITGPLAIGPGQRVVSAHSTTPGAATLNVSSLSIDPTGRLDLNNNILRVSYTGASPAAAIRAALVSGYGPTGTWTGNGISSTDAAANPNAALGYNDAGGVVTVRYTLSGDTDLDADVDFNDLATLAQNYNVTDGQRVWAQGDFTYDGNVNFDDLAKMAQNYNKSLTGTPGAAVSAEALAAMIGAPVAPTPPVVAPPPPVAPPPRPAPRPPAVKPAPKPVTPAPRSRFATLSPFATANNVSTRSRVAASIGDILQKRSTSGSLFR